MQQKQLQYLPCPWTRKKNTTPNWLESWCKSEPSLIFLHQQSLCIQKTSRRFLSPSTWLCHWYTKCVRIRDSTNFRSSHRCRGASRGIVLANRIVMVNLDGKITPWGTITEYHHALSAYLTKSLEGLFSWVSVDIPLSVTHIATPYYRYSEVPGDVNAREAIERFWWIP